MLPDRTAARERAVEADALMLIRAFGLPAEIDFRVEFADEYDLFLIEDCARALGAIYDGGLVGVFGDAAFYSLMKVSPAMKGGAAVLRSDPATVDLSPPGDDVSYYAPADYGDRNALPPVLPLCELDGLNRHIFDSFARERFDQIVRKHERTANRLRSTLGDLIAFQSHRDGRSYFWLSGAVSRDRDAFFEYLSARDFPVYRV